MSASRRSTKAPRGRSSAPRLALAARFQGGLELAREVVEPVRALVAQEVDHGRELLRVLDHGLADRVVLCLDPDLSDVLVEIPFRPVADDFLECHRHPPAPDVRARIGRLRGGRQPARHRIAARIEAIPNRKNRAAARRRKSASGMIAAKRWPATTARPSATSMPAVVPSVTATGAA